MTITARSLTCRYGDVAAVDDVDLRIDDGECVVLAGPNGSGKTTLIECVLDLVTPSEGEARVNGVPPDSFDRTDRTRLGYMPQHEAVYRDLTVRENVDFFARLYGVGESTIRSPTGGMGDSEGVGDRRSAVDRALSFVDLGDRADDRIGELSGGMVRRTSLACAVVHRPDLLFLDEPTVGLDPELRAIMWRGFREMRDDGSLVIVSTHYLEEARNCDEVLFLRDGHVLALDAPEAFLERTGTDDMEDAFLALLDETREDGDETGSGESGEDGTVGEVVS